MKQYSREIANQIRNYLDEDKWRYSFNEEKGIFEFNLSIRGGVKTVKYFIDVKETEYLVYVTPPLSVSPDDKKAMKEMAEFVCRVNYGLKQCNFELDMDGGDFMVKYYVDCAGRLPTKEIIENSLHCPAMVYKRYGDGIIRIIFLGESAEAATERCEGKQNETSSESTRQEHSGQNDTEKMRARLAARFGVDEKKETEGEEEE